MKGKSVLDFSKGTRIFELGHLNQEKREGLIFDFQYTGYELVNDKYFISRENFESVLLSYHISGNCNVILDGKDYYVQHSDDLLIIDCQRKHEVFVNKGESFKMIYIHLYSPILKDYLENLYKYALPIINLNNDEIGLQKTILEIQDSYVNNKYDVVDASIKMYALLLRLENFVKKRVIKVQTNPKFIDDTIEYISSNYKEDIDLTKIANKIGFDKYYLERSFKKYKNETIGRYIAKVRLEKAKELLSRTNMKLEQIAIEVGLNDSKSLIRLFKSYLDITPKEYRNKDFGYDLSQIERYE